MADPERLIPIEELLADPVIAAVADAYVRTEWISSEPPVWASLADLMDKMKRSREAEHQAWRALQAAKRFVEMHRALQQFPFKEQVKNG